MKKMSTSASIVTFTTDCDSNFVTTDFSSFKLVCTALILIQGHRDLCEKVESSYGSAPISSQRFAMDEDEIWYVVETCSCDELSTHFI